MLNLAVLIAYPTIGKVLPLSEVFEDAPLAWFAGIPVLLLLIAGIKLQYKLSRLQSVLGHEGWIRAVMIDAVDLSNKLKNKRILNSNYSTPPQRDLDNFGDWYSAISEYLQQNLPGEYPSWYRSVYIGNDEPSVTEVLKAYESGLDILEDIRKKFSSSIAHKEGSQTK